MKKIGVCLLSILMLVSLTVSTTAATKKIEAIQTFTSTETNEDGSLKPVATLEGTVSSNPGSNVTLTHCVVNRLGQEDYPTTEIVDYTNNTITLIGPALDADQAYPGITRPAGKNFGMPAHIVAGVVDEGGYRGWMSAAELNLGEEIADSTDVTIEFTAKISAPNTAFGWEKVLVDSYGFGLSDQNGGFGLFCGDGGEEVSFHQYIPHGIDAEVKDQSDFPTDSEMTKKNLESAFVAGAAVKMVRSGDKVKVFVNNEEIAEYECKGKTVLTFGVCSQKLEISDIKVNGQAFDLIEGSPNTSDTFGASAAIIVTAVGCIAFIVSKKRRKFYI